MGRGYSRNPSTDRSVMMGFTLCFTSRAALPILRISTSGDIMNFHIEYEREDDGRWLAEVPEIPGVSTYGATADEAMAKAEILALRALAERIETGESRPIPINIELVAA